MGSNVAGLWRLGPAKLYDMRDQLACSGIAPLR